MLILGIDTSTKLCSVALYDSEKGVLGEINVTVSKNHSHIILPMIDRLFSFAEKTVEDVERIAVGIGPGSFTGIRVGMAIAKGLAIGKNISIVGISGLEALAGSIQGRGRIFSLLDARKERVYYQVFDGGTVLCEAKDGKLKDVLEEYKGEAINYFIGDGALAYQNLIFRKLWRESSHCFGRTFCHKGDLFCKTGDISRRRQLIYLRTDVCM
ncbi:universal bacterial protein YeaZ [Fusobacterium necrophorum subsp. funduliforme 1_1_36S]|nr:universal bacterial protein YeaZ [Fusobacterium necrophorum subsp. funduliforme 1_1_36S]